MTKDSIMFWLTINRKKIGYSLGVINILLALNIISHSFVEGMILLFTGSAILFDAWSMP